MTAQSFEKKYLGLSPRLYSVACSLLGNAEDAEDAVQDVFVKLWEKRARLEQMENAEAYFLATLRNICLNKLREHHLEAAATDDWDAVPSRDEATADAPMERRETRSILKRLFGRLSPRARRVVTLRHVGEYSFRNLAEVTGETEVNLRAILSRARRQLREDYEKEIKR